MTNKRGIWDDNPIEQPDDGTIVSGIIIVLTLIIVLLFLWGPSLATKLYLYSIDQHEVKECMKWQDMGAVNPKFFINRWQKDQCDNHGVSLKARIID